MAKQSSTKDLVQQIQAQVDKVAAEQRKLDELQKKAATKLPPRPEVDMTETVVWPELKHDNNCSPADEVQIAALVEQNFRIII
jgi:hypothetical protein